VAVSTLESSDRKEQYACVEAVMSGAALQPKIHDCLVLLKHGSQHSKFRVLYKRHKFLPFNGTAQNINADVVIMRVSVCNPDHLVNLRSSDYSLVKFVLKK
ncbi:hypothetical protein R3P38DRAFT_2477543, partial [Favolaschia claudopus]